MPSTAPTRTERTKIEVQVRYVATPAGRENTNPPNLGDLRTFVEACAGLPDDLHVVIDKGNLNEGGRHNVTFSVHQSTEIGDMPHDDVAAPVEAP